MSFLEVSSVKTERSRSGRGTERTVAVGEGSFIDLYVQHEKENGLCCDCDGVNKSLSLVSETPSL